LVWAEREAARRNRPRPRRERRTGNPTGNRRKEKGEGRREKGNTFRSPSDDPTIRRSDQPDA
jgi:hypothetical protein